MLYKLAKLTFRSRYALRSHSRQVWSRLMEHRREHPVYYIHNTSYFRFPPESQFELPRTYTRYGCAPNPTLGARWAPGRFAQKPVPPVTIRLGRFAQNFERDCSHNITGTVRSKFNLLGQFTLFNIKKKVLRLSFLFFFFFF